MDISIGNEKSPIRRLEKHGVLFKEGEKADFIYVVSEGELIGVRERNKRLTPVLNAQPKSVLGLEAVSSGDGKHLYSVVAKSKCVVVPVDIELVREFFNQSPKLMSELLSTIMGKVIHTTEMLVEHRIVDDSLYGEGLFSEEEESHLLKLLKN